MGERNWWLDPVWKAAGTFDWLEAILDPRVELVLEKPPVPEGMIEFDVSYGGDFSKYLPMYQRVLFVWSETNVGFLIDNSPDQEAVGYFKNQLKEIDVMLLKANPRLEVILETVYAARLLNHNYFFLKRIKHD